MVAINADGGKIGDPLQIGQKLFQIVAQQRKQRIPILARRDGLHEMGDIAHCGNEIVIEVNAVKEERRHAGGCEARQLLPAACRAGNNCSLVFQRVCDGFSRISRAENHHMHASRLCQLPFHFRLRISLRRATGRVCTEFLPVHKPRQGPCGHAAHLRRGIGFGKRLALLHKLPVS